MIERRVLVDARTPVNYTMFAPVHRALAADTRVSVSFMAGEDPSRGRSIFRAAGSDAPVIGRLQAALTRFDAYVTSDFTWATLPRGTCRIQMFHGVGGKYGFDAPSDSMRVWHRLFFVNERRLNNCVAAGALDADSDAIRLIGMPKVDCLVDGSLTREAAHTALGLSPERPTVLYAPTWSPESSLNRMGLDIVARLAALGLNVIVKLHDRSLDPEVRYSGGVDWLQALAPDLVAGRVVRAQGADICPDLVAADVLVTDHSSAGFEFLLLDRPLVRIHLPELIALANIHPDYVALLADVSESVTSTDGVVAAVERGLADPSARSAARREVAADLFHAPGTATRRCVDALYEAMALTPCLPSA